MTFLKIISFPVRLVLFLVFGLIALVIISLTYTVGVLFLLLAQLAASVGSVLMGLFIISALIELGCLIFQPEKYPFDHNTPLGIAIIIVIAAVMCLLISFLPVIAEKIYKCLLMAAVYIWKFAKLILFCR